MTRLASLSLVALLALFAGGQALADESLTQDSEAAQEVTASRANDEQVELSRRIASDSGMLMGPVEDVLIVSNTIGRGTRFRLTTVDGEDLIAETLHFGSERDARRFFENSLNVVGAENWAIDLSGDKIVRM